VSATTAGTGYAGDFLVNNAANTLGAIKGSSNGSGYAVYGYMTGTGTAGNFENTNPTNTNPALRVFTNGTGSAGTYQIANSTNSSAVLSASTTGTGKAGDFIINNTSNGAIALSSVTNGIGRAIYSEINNASNASTVLVATTNGTGRAIDAYNGSSTRPTIRTENATNLGPAIEIVGGIKVSGTNKAAFKITSITGSGGNVTGNSLFIPNTSMANNINDILIVTHNFSPNNTYFDKTFGVFWSTLASNWAIYVEDGTNMPNNISFNVLVIKQ
jgi:hypothetical protein